MRYTASSGRSTYPVILGAGVVSKLKRILESSKCLIVTTPSALEHALAVARVIGLEHTSVLKLPDGESAKTLSSVEYLWVQINDHELTSANTLIAVGGGALTDVVGFTAATWRRGMRWVAVPTTISGMVDAAIGGKTGVNSRAGKNTGGVLWDPTAVVADVNFLATLQRSSIADGLAEVVKVGLSHPGEALAALSSWDGGSVTALIPALGAAVEVAVSVASGRFGAGNQQDVLSLGHELAHSIESVTDFQVSHGKAVALGLIFATDLAGSLAGPDTLDLLRQTLGNCGLPTRLSEIQLKLPWEQIRQALRHDKRMGGELRFLLPTQGGVKWSEVLSEERVQHAWVNLITGHSDHYRLP